MRDSEILMNFFGHASEDYILQEIYRRKGGCAYLSDSDREIKMLQQLLGMEPDSAERNAVFASMSHNIPLFSDIRLGTLVSLRQQEGDAFAAYRTALNEAAREANEKGITPERSKQIYSDILEPRVAALERKHRVLRERFKNDALIEFGVPIAALALGAFAGGGHPAAGGLLEIAGGIELIRSVGRHLKAFRDSGSSLDSVKTDPLYFLLRMKREHEKNCENETWFAKP